MQVLSKSKLGGAAAVVPQIANAPAEVHGWFFIFTRTRISILPGKSELCFSLFSEAIVCGFPQGSCIQASPAQCQDGGSLLQDILDFENNVVSRMERDMNTAMEYLQNKGFCLMPIEQETAVSNPTRAPGLGSGVTNFVERQSSGTRAVSAAVNSYSGALGIGFGGLACDFPLNKNEVGKRAREVVSTVDSNGAEFPILSSLPESMKKK